MNKIKLIEAIPNTLKSVDIPDLGDRIEGRIRDSYRVGGLRIMVTTDRIMAFDRVVGAVPFKGQVLNELSAWWFDRTRDIVLNHMTSTPDPNVMVVREATPLPVEVVVTAYMTGGTSTSLWSQYSNGERRPYDIPLPDGPQKNDPLPRPIIMPVGTTDKGKNVILLRDDIIARDIVGKQVWEQVEEASIRLFLRGQEMAHRANLILAETKYEFGIINGNLALIDEIHTPDSSRYWAIESYQQGKEPQAFDKEMLREWFLGRGFKGEGNVPMVPMEFIAQIAERYIECYERLTGQKFQPAAEPALPRILRNLEPYRAKRPKPQPAKQPLAVILIGSRTESNHAQVIAAALGELGISYEIRVGSAQKTPEYVIEMLRAYEADPRPKVYITVSGRSNALSGLVDAHVHAPVIACPPPSEAFGGGDIFSSLRMPSGVAPAVILDPTSAAILAAKILSLAEPEIKTRVRAVQARAADKIIEDDGEFRGNSR